MAKILVADDEADLQILIKQKFRRQIREKRYEFVFALNGKEALKQLGNHPDVDVVLSDINMPEMDGLSLLSKLIEVNPILKTVMVSAYGDMENIRSAMNKGAFDFVIKPINFSDLELTIEKTIKHVQQMKNTLEAIKENNILRMYVDENVLNFMGRVEVENSLMKNEQIDASVVFIDICNFTAISEKESPDVVVKLLNTYFDLIVKEIIAQNGYVDKFLGDAVMAIFKGDYHLDRAIETALSVCKQIDSLEETLVLKYYPKLSVGVNSGEMITGNIGSSSLRRLDYTVVGDTVNTAARLQSLAKPQQVLITEKAYKEIKEHFVCKEIGKVPLKNKAIPVGVYQVIE